VRIRRGQRNELRRAGGAQRHARRAGVAGLEHLVPHAAHPVAFQAAAKLAALVGVTSGGRADRALDLRPLLAAGAGARRDADEARPLQRRRGRGRVIRLQCAAGGAAAAAKRRRDARAAGKAAAALARQQRRHVLFGAQHARPHVLHGRSRRGRGGSGERRGTGKHRVCRREVRRARGGRRVRVRRGAARFRRRGRCAARAARRAVLKPAAARASARAHRIRAPAVSEPAGKARTHRCAAAARCARFALSQHAQPLLLLRAASAQQIRRRPRQPAGGRDSA
jgi:hypothetical protein